jgi:hypothetical protein
VIIVANEQNLRPSEYKLSQEEQKKGGINSGIARRKKATMKAMLEKLLDEEYKKTGKTYRELSTLGLINGAVKGNAQNYKTMLEVLGELNPVFVNADEINKGIQNIANLINNPVKERKEDEIEEDNE